MCKGDELIRRRLLVHGKVQGVFYRDSTVRTRRTKASRRRLAGQPRDGPVEVVLEGGPDAVQAMTGFCRMGPMSADVSSVDVTGEEPEGLSEFETLSVYAPLVARPAVADQAARFGLTV